MSRRVVAPVLLLVAAAVSIAAVFAVQRIESAGGPLAQPSASTYFSPNGDGQVDVAEVRFTTQRSERITVVVVDDRGRAVRTLVDGQRIEGEHEIEWDGTDDDGDPVEDGEYRIRIRRAGDARTYAPTRPTIVDTVDPIGRLDRATLEPGKVRGLALLEPGARLELRYADGAPVGELRAFLPSPDATSAQPEGPSIGGTVPVRFTAPLDLDRLPLTAVAIDKAGNERDLRWSDVDVRLEGLVASVGLDRDRPAAG